MCLNTMDVRIYLGGILLLFTGVAVPQVPPTGRVEYCNTDEFKAECKPDEVIDIVSAMYGRMHLGRCVTADYGHLGCEADVRTLTDRRCSGRLQCTIGNADKYFKLVKPCPLQFIRFLEVEYKCMKVVTKTQRSCRDNNAMTLTSAEGHLSSHVTEEQGVGSNTCPWKILLKAGQRVNVTLYDYGIPTLQEQQKAGDLDAAVCYQYALLTEKKLSPTRNTRVCSGTVRERHVYLSRGNELEVRLMPRKNTDAASQFVLKYEAVGCPYPEPPPWGYLQQDELDYNTVTVHCNNSDTWWKLTCNGNKWIATGSVEECPEGASEDSYMISWGNIKLPYGFSIGLIVGLALIIGVIILTVGLICIEWRRMRRASRMPTELPPIDRLYKESPIDGKHPAQMGYPASAASSPCRQLRNNEYSHPGGGRVALTGGGHPGPVYQVQNITEGGARGSLCSSVGGDGGAAGALLSRSEPHLEHPYGIESYIPGVNPYGSGILVPSKGKKSTLTDSVVDSEEGRHIHGSSEGIRDYKSMQGQYIELDIKSGQQQKQPQTKTGNTTTQKM